jgi:hypothetical protein
MLTLLRKIQVDQKGTADACHGSAFTTKGDIIAVSDNTGLTKLFKVSDGSLVRTIKHNEGEVSAQDGETNFIHFSSDDKFAVTGIVAKIDYRVNFTTPGKYYVWVRGQSYENYKIPIRFFDPDHRSGIQCQ